MTIQLDFALEARVTVGAAEEIGPTARGRRRFVPITGGSFAGPRLAGRVLPGGADWQIIRADGVAELVARYALETEDGARIAVVNRGLRHGPTEVMERLARGAEVDPSLYYFRSTPAFETAAGPHDWLTRAVFVASGERHRELVVIRVFRVL